MDCVFEYLILACTHNERRCWSDKSFSSLPEEQKWSFSSKFDRVNVESEIVQETGNSPTARREASRKKSDDIERRKRRYRKETCWEEKNAGQYPFQESYMHVWPSSGVYQTEYLPS